LVGGHAQKEEDLGTSERADLAREDKTELFPGRKEGIRCRSRTVLNSMWGIYHSRGPTCPGCKSQTRNQGAETIIISNQKIIVQNSRVVFQK